MAVRGDELVRLDVDRVVASVERAFESSGQDVRPVFDVLCREVGETLGGLVLLTSLLASRSRW